MRIFFMSEDWRFGFWVVACGLWGRGDVRRDDEWELVGWFREVSVGIWFGGMRGFGGVGGDF
jgi:hypothetical protein